MPTSKHLPVHLVSCSLIPVNVRCLPCTCPVSSSSTTCLANQSERKFPSHCCHPSISIVNSSPYYCACQNKFHSTTTVYPSTISISKIDDQNEYFHEKKTLKKKRSQPLRFVSSQQSIISLLSLFRHPILTDDLISISPWYKPHLER